MAVVTVSGQIGSGAREIGRLAAARLDINYVDQEILVEAARQLGVPMEAVVSHDERTAGFGERLANMLRRFLERSAAAGAADPTLGSGGLDAVLGRTYSEAALEGTPDISDERYIETLGAIVRDLSAHDNVLVIGRGSQVFLKDRAGVLHVLLVGPLEARIDTFAQREGVSRDEAARQVREGDKGRCAFHQRFLGVHPDDPSLYHLALNTTLVPYDEVARIVADAAGSLASPSAAP